MLVKKKTGKQVEAYQLGKDSAKEKDMIGSGRIRPLDDGSYEVFSQEAVNGKGEHAQVGDYFKIDNAGFPYPNSKEYFEREHRKIGEDLYEQIPKELQAWSLKEGETPEIRFLKENRGLVISEDHMEAPLWGSILSADPDAVIVYYSVQKNLEGEIQDIDFNFVARNEFEKTYDVLGGEGL